MANPNPIQTAAFKAQQKPRYGERALGEALAVRFPEDVDRALRKMSDRQEYIRKSVEKSLLADGLIEPRKGLGPESTNSDKSNEDRIEESVQVVMAAVEALQKLHDWNTLGVKQRIKLLQTQTLEMRGTAISSQTLYRPWIRKLW